MVSVLGTGATMQLDKERMFSAFHQVRFNPDLLGVLTAEISAAVPEDLQCQVRRFVQVFLDDLLDAVIELRATKATEVVEKSNEPVNAHD